MMWRKVMDDGEVIVAPTVEGPGFSLGPNDTVGADGWEPVPDDYTTDPDDKYDRLEALYLELLEMLLPPEGGA